MYACVRRWGAREEGEEKRKSQSRQVSGEPREAWHLARALGQGRLGSFLKKGTRMTGKQR